MQLLHRRSRMIIAAVLTAVALALAGVPAAAQEAPEYDHYVALGDSFTCLLYTSPSPRDRTRSRMPSSA